MFTATYWRVNTSSPDQNSTPSAVDRGRIELQFSLDDEEEYIPSNSGESIFLPINTVENLSELASGHLDRESMKSVQHAIPIIRERICAALGCTATSPRTTTPSILFERIFYEGRMESELLKLVNKGLNRSGKRVATKKEIRTAVGCVLGCAFYQFSLQKLFEEANKTVYNVFNADFNRVKEIISAAGVKHEQAEKNEPCFTPLYSVDRDISSMEETFASI